MKEVGIFAAKYQTKEDWEVNQAASKLKKKDLVFRYLVDRLHKTRVMVNRGDLPVVVESIEGLLSLFEGEVLEKVIDALQ